MNRHPMQQIVKDDNGVIRFRRNAIVEFLLLQGSDRGDAFGQPTPGRPPHTRLVPGAANLNDLAEKDFPAEDWEQFYQLIGYSIDGFCELSRVGEATKDVAYDVGRSVMAGKTPDDPRDKMIWQLERKLQQLRDHFRKGVCLLYGIHPDSTIGAE